MRELKGEYTLVTKWGMGDGKFDWPYDIAVDSTGDVYVADTNKFASKNTLHSANEIYISNVRYYT